MAHRRYKCSPFLGVLDDPMYMTRAGTAPNYTWKRELCATSDRALIDFWRGFWMCVLSDSGDRYSRNSFSKFDLDKFRMFNQNH